MFFGNFGDISFAAKTTDAKNYAQYFSFFPRNFIRPQNKKKSATLVGIRTCGRFKVVRLEGVEPSSQPWEGHIIAVIRQTQKNLVADVSVPAPLVQQNFTEATKRLRYKSRNRGAWKREA